MPGSQDPASWYTKPEAAAILGVSARTIERMADRGELHTMERRRHGRRPEIVYSPADIDARKAAEQKAVTVMPAAAAPPASSALLLQRFLALAAPRIVAADKTWLTIDEAAEISGLSAALIKRAIRAGALQAIRDRATKIHRQDLAKFDPRKATRRPPIAIATPLELDHWPQPDEDPCPNCGQMTRYRCRAIIACVSTTCDPRQVLWADLDKHFRATNGARTDA